ncbi:MAG TPA: hypothetical protein VF269_08480 [Rhodanobacteraceae bacterium]
MFTRTLISLTASVLITAGTIAALASPNPFQPLQADAVNGMPVTTLPTITVTAPAIASSTANTSTAHNHTVAAMGSDSAFSHLLADVTVQLGKSHLDMPYYSFGSASVRMGKD